MADLNALIAQGAQFRQAPDPFVQYGQMQQLEQNRQTNALNQMKMQEAQATMAERNALRQLNPSASDYESQLFKVNPTIGIAYRKEASSAAAQKTAAEKQNIESAKMRQGMLGQAFRDISSRPSDANITAHMEDVLASPLFSKEEKAKVQRQTATLLSMPVEERGSFLSSQGATAGDISTAATAKAGQAATVQTARDRLAFDREKDAYERANPGFTIEKVTEADGTEKFKKVNKQTGVATDVMNASGVAVTGVNLPAQTAAIRQKFDQDKLNFERANPGFTIEKVTQADGTEKFKKVNKQTGEATDVMDVSGTALTGAAKITLSPLATLQRDLTNAPPNSKQADQLRAKILKEITDTSQAQLKLAQDRFAWDKANPGYHIDAINNPDGSQRFVAVNKQTLKAYPITEAAIGSGTPPNVGAPLVGVASGVAPAAAPAQTLGGPAPVAAQPSSAPATQGQQVPLTSARPYKEPTVSEQNAGYNIGRILRGATSIQDVIAKDPTALAPKIGEAVASSVGLSGAANVARTANRQKVYGAQRDVIDALLYLATGAAYNKEQLAAQLDTYMPQYTDKPANVIEKQQRLVELINDAKTRAGKAWTPKMDAAMNVLNIQSAAPGGVDANNPLLK